NNVFFDFRSQMANDDPEIGSSPHAEEILANPKILSVVLGHLNGEDRLNLRLCSKIVEKAVANSSIRPIWIFIRERPGTFSVSFDDLTLKSKNNDDPVLEELLRVRRRLFAQVSSNIVYIRSVNFNTFPITYIERFLEDVVFDELSITIQDDDYNLKFFDFLRKYDEKKIDLTTYNLLLLIDLLLSLKPLRRLHISRLFGIPTYNENEFLALVKQRHSILEIPVTVDSEMIILDTIESIYAYRGSQSVHFQMSMEVMDRFLLKIGIRRIAENMDQLSYSDDFKLTPLKYETGKGAGRFILDYRETVKLVVQYYFDVTTGVPSRVGVALTKE
ncbi:hypothetical protein PMAYCL1PPCAC_22885, partial [Pristionchus mayeri]